MLASLRSMPGLSIDLMLRPPPSGTLPPVAAALRTPGTRAICSTICVMTGATSRGLVRSTTGGEIWVVSTFSGSKPGSMRSTDTKLPMKSDAPTTSTTASASSTTTNRFLSRRLPAPVLPRPPLLSAVVRSTRELCRAGMMPKRMPVTSDSRAAAASTRRLSAIAATRGTSSEIADRRIWMPHEAATTASAVPAIERTRLSISSCRTSRQRLAPSVARIPTSR